MCRDKSCSYGVTIKSRGMELLYPCIHCHTATYNNNSDTGIDIGFKLALP